MLYLTDIIVYVVIFLLGLSIGSFLNVVIYRVPRGESIVFGRSHCTSCGVTIGALDLIPVVSYLLLKGKCRNCQNTISPRYGAVELSTGLLFVLTFVRMGVTPMAVVGVLFAALLIAVSVIDWDTMTIPDGLVIAAAVLAVPFYLIQDGISLPQRLIGFFIVSLPMLLLATAIGGAFGGGDIKLIAVCGFILGAKNVVLAMFIAVLLGGSYASYLLLTKKSKVGTQIPFGPYLCAGCYLSMLFGTDLVGWYLGQF